MNQGEDSMFYFQAELIAKQKQHEIEIKAKDAWKFSKGFEGKNINLRNSLFNTSTRNVPSCCCCTA